MNPRILVVEHEAACPPALLGRWLAEAGCELTVSRVWAGEEIPGLREHDGWLVLGGSGSAYDDRLMPWLPTVRARLAEAAEQGVPALGVCLGHQLAAVATGGTVEKGPHGQRVGLFDIGWTPAASDDGLLGPLATPRRAVQWNGDVVAATDGEVLAALPDGELQAVRFAPSLWGVQWHPEVDRPILESWAEGDRQDHDELGIDQEAVLDAIEAATAELELAWRPLADSFARLVRGPRG